jgi:hypothetical protein
MCRDQQLVDDYRVGTNTNNSNKTTLDKGDNNSSEIMIIVEECKL